MIDATLRDEARAAELARQRRDAGLEPYQIVVEATVKAVNGSVRFAYDPNMVWVSMYDTDHDRTPVYSGEIVTADDESMAGLPVLVKRTPRGPYQWEIIGINRRALIDGGLQSLLGNYHTQHHGENHQIPTEANAGPDPVYIWPPALMPLKTVANGTDLTATVHPLIWWKDGVRQVFLGEYVDLSGYVPAAGNAVRLLLYLDKGTNTVGVEAGAEVSGSGAVPVPYPERPAGVIPSGYVTLEGGQTAISQASDVEEARELLGGGGLARPLVFDNPALITLSGGAFTATTDHHPVAAETGTFDDLTTINPADDYQMLLLRADTGDTITVKHGTGNIYLNGEGDVDLTGNKALLLVYDAGNAVWTDVAFGSSGTGSTITPSSSIRIELPAPLFRPVADPPSPTYTELETGIPVWSVQESAGIATAFVPEWETGGLYAQVDVYWTCDSAISHDFLMNVSLAAYSEGDNVGTTTSTSSVVASDSDGQSNNDSRSGNAGEVMVTTFTLSLSYTEGDLLRLVFAHTYQSGTSYPDINFINAVATISGAATGDTMIDANTDTMVDALGQTMAES